MRRRSPFHGFVLAVAVLAGSLTSGLRAVEPQDWARANLPSLVELYRHLHAHPELSNQETQTAARLAQELKAAGVEVTTGVGGTGVVGLLKNGPGKTILLRTDMDALPVSEQTELVFGSKVRVRLPDGGETGVMHACGHDVHMTNLIGAARCLANLKDRWSGTLLFICQPAEETGEGAAAMLKDRLFERFGRPDYALAVHVDAHLAAGKVGYRAGYAMANVDSVEVIVRGKGGHGAAPHNAVDPIVQAAHLVVDLQTLVSREVPPTESAVVTVGSIQGGTKYNIIPDECRLKLTVRSYNDDTRALLLSGIRRKALAVAQAHRAPEPIVRMAEGFTPALKNDAALVDRLTPVFRRVLGPANVEPADPTLGGEDFSQFGLAGVPVFMWRIGAVDAKRLARFESLGTKGPSLHSPLFYPDVEPALVTGVTSVSAAVLELLPKNP